MAKDIKGLLKRHLLSGKTITGLQALRKFGTIRLAVYIQRLKKDGYRIDKEMVTKGEKTFAKYFHQL